MSKKIREGLIKKILFIFGSVSILITISIFATLLSESLIFFQKVPILNFLFGTKWTPLFKPQNFGVLPLVAGTFLIVIFSSLISLPIGLLSAIYLSEYSHMKVRKIVKPFIEILAGIPSIVYGYFALTTITPIIRKFYPDTSIYNALSASIAVGIMTIPMVLSLSEDSMRAVPKSLREGAYALGLTKLEVVFGVVIPASFSGIVASFILAISRAIGETMIVALAAGATPKLTLNPLESIQTMTGFIVQISQGDVVQGTIEAHSLFAVAMLLFVITLTMNLLSKLIVNRFKEDY
ncbi:phosphate ABC transporter permease subunit PstC [Paramaledivibacter caminithermalis]|uniref:Phosphate transport system permease protein n=1 Tax=Paramaledivibacter caminithermalis (strain DSM 15212 / CIP 107654 / DViRD3) TaxID=1121301 RepID=A0A1M6KTE1_PARC5|nr:phosphate ABC transporter permease subunit PstC [Paramaledivibacter caminithermalis]SHJ62189.1 phosphate ABC transporter membrane protein 1, PhoT family (TC 3.A.1.7.1) [Paramaledivibacter caminithermalis DSM 15212]